jgi:hypothetical protein
VCPGGQCVDNDNATLKPEQEGQADTQGEGDAGKVCVCVCVCVLTQCLQSGGSSQCLQSGDVCGVGGIEGHDKPGQLQGSMCTLPVPWTYVLQVSLQVTSVTLAVLQQLQVLEFEMHPGSQCMSSAVVYVMHSSGWTVCRCGVSRSTYLYRSAPSHPCLAATQPVWTQQQQQQQQLTV